MRVTQSMMVNNMAYWASQQSDKLQDAQTVVGSGKKINNPSDDPQAAGQIQADRVSLSQYSQYESNIAQAKTWVGVGTATLDLAFTTLQNAGKAVYSAEKTETPLEPVPDVATSSIKPTINLYSGTSTGGTFSATMNIYDSDLKAVPLTLAFTKTAANAWSYTTSIPGGTAVSAPGNLTFTAAGQLSGGVDQTIALTFADGSTQNINWNLSDADVASGLTQYAAKSSIGDNPANVSVNLLTSFYNQILSLANSLYGSSYMYAGNLSDAMPFAMVDITAPGVADLIAYDLASAATKVDIQVINSAGVVVRNILGTGLAALPAHNTMAWNGCDNAGNNLPDGRYSFIVTASNAAGDIVAYPTYYGDNGGKEVLTGVNERLVLNNNGEDIFSSILSNISRAITAITNDDTAAISSVGAALQANIKALELKQVELSNAGVQLGGASTRVKQLTSSALNRLSELETASPEESAIKLQAQQTAYEQVISVTANALRMPKLTDYI